MAAVTPLEPCPTTPNCVSTEATDKGHGIAPISFSTSSAEAAARLLDVLREMPRAKIVASDERSIRVEFRTAIFRFVDDAVFVIDGAAKSIRFRSASRIGRSDFGVNRRRMESIRTLSESRGDSVSREINRAR
jgi:uncharacterized protein (DUF1499 family)